MDVQEAMAWVKANPTVGHALIVAGTLADELTLCYATIREIWSLRFIPDGVKSCEATAYDSLDGEQVTPSTMACIQRALAAREDA